MFLWRKRVGVLKDLLFSFLLIYSLLVYFSCQGSCYHSLDKVNCARIIFTFIYFLHALLPPLFAISLL